ncbi:hypothetical protein L1S35_05240 [Flavobacterium sp. AS60]|uniref:hypothetical protein n=1 Tax=Flavobacterium anseongense TaxID=2910677 RepID=UPI001F1FAB7C|nr:hypothetical protein [Flavobacterium sp. AS60]MCF6129069.1 hypothetical protein [Flavobacterium sp. AS60]
MKNLSIKILAILLFTTIASCYSQQKLKTVAFEIYAEKNQPMPGANIAVKNSNPTIETQTDFDGKANLKLENLNVEIGLSILGPSITFKLFENIDLVKVDIKKQKVEYYSKNRILKKDKLKVKGY